MRACTVALATLLAGSFTLVSPRASVAQELVPGLRIRSQALTSDEWRVGTLVRYGRDSLVMQRCVECAPEAQSWAGISRVEVSEGTSSSVRNIAVGALAGGVLAAVIHAQKVKRNVASCDGGPCLEGLEIPVAGLLGAASGAVIGALWRVESWREIYGAEPARD